MESGKRLHATEPDIEMIAAARDEVVRLLHHAEQYEVTPAPA